MGREIERKFLLRDDSWRSAVLRSRRLLQGYLARDERSAIRVRIRDDQAELNIKQALDGVERREYEYPIPVSDARELLEFVALRPLIDKTRHCVEHAGHLWEIDEFHADNDGLIVAEIELGGADEAFERPAWLGIEVSHDKRYYNSNLSRVPFNQW